MGLYLSIATQVKSRCSDSASFVKTFNIMLLKEHQKIEKQKGGTAASYQTLPNSSDYKSTVDKWTEMGGS